MHNYQKKLNTMIASGELRSAPGTLTNASVYHESWCGIHSQRECNCEPDIRVEPLRSPANAARIADLPELSDDAKITLLYRTLVQEGRKRGVHGTIAIRGDELVQFAQDLQTDIAARFPNQGVGVAMEVMAPVAMEETELAIERFWSRPHTPETAAALQYANAAKN